ncbi:MAG: choice-of-anchor B family protein [Saprospiraceae bacterium]
MKKTFYLILLFVVPIFMNGQATKLKLLGHWRDPELKGSAQYDNTFNEAYGFTVNNREYGIIGSTFGFHIIDITDPTNPFERYRIKGGESGTNVIHRDFRYYNCHIYAVCDEGTNSTLQIVDVSNLPDTAIVVYNKNDLFFRSHNIFIDEAKARLYTSDEKNASGFYPLGLYDIKNPSDPKFLGHYNVFGDITANDVHDCYVRNDTAYLNCGYNGFAIMNFADYLNPKPIFTLKPNEYLYSGYNHSGWLTPNGKTYVMADENHGSPLKVIDLSDFNNIKVVSYLSICGDSTKAIPHNPLISCNYAYVAYYYDGLQVYDISNPKDPKLKYYYPTSTEPNLLNFKGAWGTFPFMPSGNIIVADMQNGMFIVEGPEKVCFPNNICISTDSKNIEAASTIISPNPFINSLSIQSDRIIQDFIIANLQGEIVYRVNNIHSEKVDLQLNDLEAGLYILKGRCEDRSDFYHKLIKLNVR